LASLPPASSPPKTRPLLNPRHPRPSHLVATLPRHLLPRRHFLVPIPRRLISILVAQAPRVLQLWLPRSVRPVSRRMAVSCSVLVAMALRPGRSPMEALAQSQTCLPSIRAPPQRLRGAPEDALLRSQTLERPRPQLKGPDLVAPLLLHNPPPHRAALSLGLLLVLPPPLRSPPSPLEPHQPRSRSRSRSRRRDNYDSNNNRAPSSEIPSHREGTPSDSNLRAARRRLALVCFQTASALAPGSPSLLC
jgi:hypothetical protein